MKLLLYMLVMAGVTYLMRAVPFVLCRRKIRSRFLRSFLCYIPYAVLSAMSVPAIFFCTGSLTTAIVGTAIALILSFFNQPLIVVSLAAAVSALITGLLL